MHKLLLIIPILFTLACTNNNAAPNSTAAPGSAASQSTGATYSANIDGKAFSGTTTNGASPVSLEQNATIDGLSFQLGYAAPQNQGFQFVIKNTGTTELRSGQIITVCNYKAEDGTRYIDDSATVTLKPGTGTRTVGTFSGRWKNAHYGRTNPNAPATITVTDGQFDLP